MLAERIGMDERPIVFCENMLREQNTFFIAQHHLPVAEPAQQAEHFFVHRNGSGASVFGRSLLYAFTRNGAAGMLDNDIALVAAGHDHIRPAQGAQFSAAHPRVDGKKVEQLEDRFFIAEGGEKFLHFLHRRNLLRFSFCIRQVDHAGWIFLDDLVAFCVAENR